MHVWRCRAQSPLPNLLSSGFWYRWGRGKERVAEIYGVLVVWTWRPQLQQKRRKARRAKKGGVLTKTARLNRSDMGLIPPK